MTVLAIFRYEIALGRIGDFMFKLNQASSADFDSPSMPKTARLFRSTVPGPDTAGVTLILEYQDMTAYGARSEYETSNPEWCRLFEATSDSPERLVSVELLTSIDPAN